MSIIGRRIVAHDRVESTNDAVRDLAGRDEPEGLVVTADEQTAGRGRLARRWISPPGTSLQLSVLLRPPLAPEHAARLVRMAALAVHASLMTLPPLRPGLKWPNDILLRGKKCAGILVESSIQGVELDYSVVGIGLNLNFAMADFPELAPFATTVADELGRPVDRAAVQAVLLEQLEAYYARVREGDPLLQEYRAALVMLGRRVRVTVGDTALDGTAQDVADDGALVLALGDRVLQLYAGDVKIEDIS
jgi:BirA family biotin operon repressor/biotin-[acetyl-CoA-carboxylase] ligase